MKNEFITVFENQDFIVINKPSGLLSIPDRFDSEVNVKQLLIEKYGQIFTVHRLDKYTSGLIMFAKNEQTHKSLSTLFSERKIVKKYLGLVHGKPIEPTSILEFPLLPHASIMGKMIVHEKGKIATTKYQVIEQFKHFSLLEFDIYTGRTHQIRVQMQHIGHPIVCDILYGSAEPILLSTFKKKFKLSKNQETENPILNRQALHAQQLHFTLNGEDFSFQSALTKDLEVCLNILRRWGK